MSRAKGIAALQKYYNYLGDNKPDQWTTFNDFLRFFQRDQFSDFEDPTILDDWGFSVDLLDSGRVEFSMRRLADATSKSKAPSRQSFFNTLSSAAAGITLREVGTAVIEGVKEAGTTVAGTVTKTIGTGVGLYVGATVLAFLGLSLFK
jgi:hypothetical protein